AACWAGPCAAIAALRALTTSWSVAAPVRVISLHRREQVGYEVVTLLKLDVDVGEGLADPLPHRDELVVDHDDPQHEDDDHSDNDPARPGHGIASWQGSQGSNGRVTQDRMDRTWRFGTLAVASHR